MVSNELIDVLFYKNIKEFLQFYREIEEKYYQHDKEEYRNQLNNYYIDKIKTKENFIKLIDDYSINGKTIWQEQKSQNCDNLNQSDIIKALKNASLEHGEKLYLQNKKLFEKWEHIEHYGNAVNFDDNLFILELSIGGGGGTCAVIDKLLPNNHLISVDIDFCCARNADGIAKYLNLTNRVCGLNANFWYLPFEDSVFDTVCSHWGLDESRELPAVIKETSRVLKKDGRFVVLTRANPYDRHRNLMNMFELTESECNPLLKKARLYSGFDDLVEYSKKHDLYLKERKLYKTGQHKILSVFQKRI